METFELIKSAICKVQPGIDAEKIVPSAHLGEDLEIDSLGRVELALAMEESFGFYLYNAKAIFFIFKCYSFNNTR